MPARKIITILSADDPVYIDPLQMVPPDSGVKMIGIDLQNLNRDEKSDTSFSSAVQYQQSHVNMNRLLKW